MVCHCKGKTTVVIKYIFAFHVRKKKKISLLKKSFSILCVLIINWGSS